MNSAIYALLIALGAGLTGWHFGAKNERATWEAEKITMQRESAAAVQARIDENKLLQDSFNATARKVSDDHENALKTLKDQLAADQHLPGLLRIQAAACKPPAGQAAPTGADKGNDTGTGTVALSESYSANLLGLANEADQLAEQLRALQQWVIDSGLYGPAPP